MPKTIWGDKYYLKIDLNRNVLLRYLKERLNYKDYILAVENDKLGGEQSRHCFCIIPHNMPWRLLSFTGNFKKEYFIIKLVSINFIKVNLELSLCFEKWTCKRVKYVCCLIN